MSSMYLAVDSGGSKTIWRVLNEVGETLTSVITEGMASVFPRKLPVGEYCAKAYETISRYGTPKKIYVSLGGPNTEEVAEALKAFWRDLPVTVGREASGDCMLAAAAYMGCSGVVLCGTGSTAVGVKGGRRCYAGGWGPVYGDEGSGGGLGKQALCLFLQSLNGTGRPCGLSPLFAELTAGLDPTQFADRMEVKKRAINISRRDLGKLAPKVYELAVDGIQEAAGLYQEAAQQIAVLAADVCDDTPEAAVLLCGGFLRNKPLLLEQCRACFQKLSHARLVYDEAFDPIVAASVSVLEQGGIRITNEIFKNILNEKGVK